MSPQPVLYIITAGLFPNKYLVVVYVFFSSIKVCELKSRDCVIYLVIPIVLSTMPGT